MGHLAETAEGWRAHNAAVPTAWPIEAVLTSGFGWRRSPFTRRWKFHSGLDLAAPRGTPIYAAADGEVIWANWDSGYGRLVEIDHGNNIITRYGHNSRLYVQEGDHVRQGQLISTVGMTGQTTGPHLHYEIHVDGVAVDPLDYLR
jgi:murein DD-endopeptidase MepM/ murein hydrolase activator NlpD